MKYMAFYGGKTEIVEHLLENLVSKFFDRICECGWWVIAVLASCIYNGCG